MLVQRLSQCDAIKTLRTSVNMICTRWRTVSVSSCCSYTWAWQGVMLMLGLIGLLLRLLMLVLQVVWALHMVHSPSLLLLRRRLLLL